MKISVSSYSYQQKIKTGEMTQLDVPRVASEMGIEGIDFTELKPNAEPTLQDQLEYAKQIRAEVEKYGIEVVGYTVPANLYQGSPEADEAEVERLKGQVDVAVAMGAKVMRHDVCKKERQEDGTVVSFAKMLPTIAANARKIADYAQSKGIKTCSENHGYVAQDSDRVEALYNAVDHENYGLLVDFGNFACVDEVCTKAVSRLAPYAIHVHAKDFRIYPHGRVTEEKGFSTRGCNKLVGCAIGEGDVNVAQCVAIMKRAGYDGFMTIEYEGNEDCMIGIEKGYKNLKKYIEG
ncbi:MAG: sugar phosphate isomerase/epimerase [Clostridia bacterium]|nr:sugar phosphate isomerase/epimerase [Clostridia bacterium]